MTMTTACPPQRAARPSPRLHELATDLRDSRRRMAAAPTPEQRRRATAEVTDASTRLLTAVRTPADLDLLASLGEGDHTYWRNYLLGTGLDD
jgi:hypothetical protein